MADSLRHFLTMIGVLDTLRADLEDLGGGLGVTDPVSGELVLSLP